jgi:DUF438 domain-containing protein
MELLGNDDEALGRLIEYIHKLHTGESDRATWDAYAPWLTTADPLRVNAAIDSILSGTLQVMEYKQTVARFIRATGQGLDKAELPEYPPGHLLRQLDEENREIGIALDSLMVSMKALPKDIPEGHTDFSSLGQALSSLHLLQGHYVRLQNELFPLLEEATPRHNCLKLMWALEDEVLRLYGTAKSLVAGSHRGEEIKAYEILGTFFDQAHSLIYRERRILYPVAWRMVSPDRFAPGATLEAGSPLTSGVVSLSTGTLGVIELEALFKLLPVDVSFIDKDDRVRFYSDPPHRIFPRSPGVIGRRVQNCHPPKSVATVEKILETFKNGTRDSEEFWLELHGRFIHIQYFAVRDPSGSYLGTLEVSMDATHLRALEGEKRLL